MFPKTRFQMLIRVLVSSQGSSGVEALSGVTTGRAFHQIPPLSGKPTVHSQGHLQSDPVKPPPPAALCLHPGEPGLHVRQRQPGGTEGLP